MGRREGADLSRVYSPQIEVLVTKISAREDGRSIRFAGADNQIDLTPYLGDHGSVSVQKSLSSPAGGFLIALPDQAYRAAMDSFYGVLEPMDMVEIRMGYAPGRPPVLMRGFIHTIQRTETVEGGRPIRSVNITGHDYGAVLNWIRFLWRAEYLNNEGNPLLTVFKLQDKNNMPIETLPAGETMQQLIEQVVNASWLVPLAERSPAVQPLAVDEPTVTDGAIGPWSVGGHHGDVWSFIQAYGDLDWNECFIEDREDGPAFVYRPMPYRDAYDPSIYLHPLGADPGSVGIDAADLLNISVQRGGARVLNWVWVDAPMGSLLNPGMLNLQSIYDGTPLLDGETYPNADPTLFGYRELTVQTAQTGVKNIQLPAGEPAAARKEWEDIHAEWFAQRRDIMVDFVKDNSVLEEGTLTLRGTYQVGGDYLRPGKYLDLTRGDFAASYYCIGVAHDYHPFDAWTTTVSVERGTGLVDRQRAVAAPIWLEGRPGGYR